MTTDIEPVGPEGRAIMKFDQEQIDLIKSQICQGATNAELRLFIEVCERTGLNPFAKQIYWIKRGNTGNPIQPSIDGQRLIAERTNKYLGQTPMYWCGPDRIWTDVWLDEGTPPAAARVGVYKRDAVEPTWGVATYKAYVQTGRDGKPTGQWATNASNQLAKCAESLALRKAFPQELSGLYTREEMGQAENVVTQPAASKVGEKSPSPQGTLTAEPPPVTSVEGIADEVALGARRQELKEAIDGLDDEGKVALKAAWTAHKLPPLRAVKTDEHFEMALELVAEAWASGADPVTGEVVGSEDLDPERPFDDE